MLQVHRLLAHYSSLLRLDYTLRTTTFAATASLRYLYTYLSRCALAETRGRPRRRDPGRRPRSSLARAAVFSTHALRVAPL